jgi:hypothetical protein
MGEEDGGAAGTGDHRSPSREAEEASGRWSVASLRGKRVPDTFAFFARDLMKDQALAKSLPPLKTPQEILQKYGGDFEKAIAAAKRTNPDVNKAIDEIRGAGDK